MKYVRYMGDFLSRAGVVWHVEILQENAHEYDEIGGLTFEAEEALTIEYPSNAKEDVICGSTATLQIESPGDRTYEDLYTIDAGAIRLDVYRAGALYWSGTLDPEFYEEPYEKAAHYVVSLTFSDFGILDRLKYTLADMRTIKEVVTHCLAMTKINYGSLDESLISTSLPGAASAMSLSDLIIRSDNFYDEDGEASTLKEVLEAMLQPLGLRMVQRVGKVYIYDINGLYSKAPTAEAIWSGDSSTMSTDVVYKNAKITWSPYAQSGNLAPETCWTEKTDANLLNINSITAKTYEGSEYWSYHYSTNLWDWLDATDSGFTLYTNTKGTNATLNPYFTGTRFFKIVPQYDGDEAEGIALYWAGLQGFQVGGSGWNQAQLRLQFYGVNPNYLGATVKDIDKYLFRSSPVWVPPVDTAQKLLLNVGLELLLDPRFNPSEGAANIMKNEEEKDWQEQWKRRGNFLYVPVTIKFQPDNSSAIYCWDNRSIIKQAVGSPIKTLQQTYGEWKRYDTTKDDAPEVWGYLAYYDAGDRAENCGVAQGWKVNRAAINPHTAQLTTVLEQAEAGQFIPYPSYGAGGKIWVEVRGKGWVISDGGVNLSETQRIDTYGLWDGGGYGPKMRWILAKLPTIEIVNNVQFEQTISTDDVEYEAELNSSAKEPIEIDTMCGSSAAGVPTARGAYFKATNGEQIKTLTRAGRTSQVEELLIGTLYSQYAARKTKLDGEIELHPDGLVSYTEQNQDDKKFILIGETQDVIMDTTEATLIEIRPDEYDKQS